MALGALIIMVRLGLTDEELIEQIKQNPYLQSFIGFEDFQTKVLFDPSMIVFFRKRLPEDVLNDCNERIQLLKQKSMIKTTIDTMDHCSSMPPEHLWIFVLPPIFRCLA